jgi:hypothetical protein
MTNSVQRPDILVLFILCIVTQLLQHSTNQMHICHNLMLHSTFYIFRALKAHHQEDSCKNTGILWYNVCSHILYGIW